MNVSEIRAKYWRLRNLMQQQGAVTPTLDREIALTQLEILTEIAAQLAEANAVLARIGVLNFEQTCQRLSSWARTKAKTWNGCSRLSAGSPRAR